MPRAPIQWNRLKYLDQALTLIDRGITVKWSHLSTVTRRLSEDNQIQLIRHLVQRICADEQDRIHDENTVETLLLWLAFTRKDIYLRSAVEQFFAEPESVRGCMKLIQIGLSSEIADSKHQDDAYAAAVMLICDLGKTIEQKNRSGEESFVDAHKLLPQITTYLLSVSNLNNYVIRLSLLHYFGYMTRGGKNHAEFDRVMNRFGYTVLEFLFQLLFQKKTEGIALQFLLDNFPFILEAPSSSQRIIHEIFKYYILKQPDRCSLFLQTLGDSLNQESTSKRARHTFLQHLGALLQVASKINHKPLVYDLLSSIYRIKDPFVAELSEQIHREAILDEQQSEFAHNLENGIRPAQNPVHFLRSHKRGRHPSFHRSKVSEVFEQVAILGSLVSVGHEHMHSHAKAS